MSVLGITGDEESDAFFDSIVTTTFDRGRLVRVKLKRSSAFTIYSLELIDDRLKLKIPQFEASVWREREGFVNNETFFTY